MLQTDIVILPPLVDYGAFLEGTFEASKPLMWEGAYWRYEFGEALRAAGLAVDAAPYSTYEMGEPIIFCGAAGRAGDEPAPKGGFYVLREPQPDLAAWGAWWNCENHTSGFWQDEHGPQFTAKGLRELARSELWAYETYKDGDPLLAEVLQREADRLDPERKDMPDPWDDDDDDDEDKAEEDVPDSEGEPAQAGAQASTAPSTEVGPAQAATPAPVKLELPAKLKGKLGIVPTPQAVSLEDFLQRRFPPRDYLLEPVITEQILAMLYAARGTGKTYFALTIGYAVASGGAAFHCWRAPQPRRVLYLDGEMAGGAMQERLARIAAGFDVEPPPGYFSIVTPDLVQDGLMPNLATPGGQAAIEPLLEGVDLVIVDNLATLARAGKENEAESWTPVQAWLLAQRRAGRSVLLVHHSGKGGDQRGTSAREDVLDVVIKLSRPQDYKPDQGARVIVELTKARGITGPEADPFEATLMTNLEGGAIWATRPIADLRVEQVRELSALGLSVREVAEEVGVPKSTVARLLKRLKAAQ